MATRTEEAQPEIAHAIHDDVCASMGLVERLEFDEPAGRDRIRELAADLRAALERYAESAPGFRRRS